MTAMRMRPLLIVVLSLVPATTIAAAGACGGVTYDPDDDAQGGAGGGTGGDDATSGSAGHQSDGGGGKDAFDEYVDPGCPDAGPPISDFQCDPYAQGNGQCAPGDGCFIYVQYPEEPCGQEIYGSVCAPQGPGQQGDGCGGALDCSGGYVCVISGSGNQCVQLCALAGEDGCPSGLVCEPIDVEGFGGCL
jgi:hypothetical protein